MIMNEFIGGSNGRSTKYGITQTDIDNAPVGSIVHLAISKLGGSQSASYDVTGYITSIKTSAGWVSEPAKAIGASNRFLLIMDTSTMSSNPASLSSVKSINFGAGTISSSTLNYVVLDLTQSVLVSA